MAFLLSLTRAIRLSQSASSKVFQLLLPCISPHPEDNGNCWEEQLGYVRPTASCSHIATFSVVSNWPGCLRKQRQHWGMSREGASTPECLRPPRAAADNAVVLLSLCQHGQLLSGSANAYPWPAAYLQGGSIGLIVFSVHSGSRSL